MNPIADFSSSRFVGESWRKLMARVMHRAARALSMLLALVIFIPTVHGTASWTSVASLGTPRFQHTATLLPSGKVLVAGGFNGGALSSAEIYDPASNTWTGAGALGTERYQYTATLLPSGKILAVGGFATSGFAGGAELYDPSTNAWSAASSPSVARANHTATLLPSGKVLVAGGQDASDSVTSVELYDPATNAWSAAAALHTARAAHSATLLGNGKVLIVGGYNSAVDLASAEIYDPVANTWTSIPSLATARYFHTASALPNGKVLIAGGANGTDGALATTQLYDPATNNWSTTASLPAPRYQHAATLLPNGTLLIAGGANTGGVLSGAELYDPGADTWTATASLNAGRFNHTSTVLPNGTVFVAGGQGSGWPAAAEVYDLAVNSWTPAASLNTARYHHTATLLPNGKVLLAGGYGTSGYIASTELYNPATNTSAPAASLNTARHVHSATLLPNGRVLVAGGAGTSGYLASTELYDPATNTWTPAGSLNTARYIHTATLLPNGKVLVAGGYGTSGVLASSELYDPATNTWAPATSLNIARYYPAATLLQNGKVLVAGGWGTSGDLASAELYDPATNTWTAAASLNIARHVHSATLLPNGKVLVAGGAGTSGYLASTELYDPATNTWTAAASLSTARSVHTATLLPNGKVLVAGGSGSSVLASAELFDTGLVPDTSRQPSLSSVGGTGNLLTPGVAPSATGSGFQPNLETSGGGTWSNSATNFPLLQVMRLDNEETAWLPVDPSEPFNDTTFISTAGALSGWPYGHVRVTAFVNGIPSSSVLALYAPTYTVSYDDNGSTGGSVPVDGNHYAAGATVTVLGNTGSLVKSGSTFNNWNTASDGSGTGYSGGQTFNMGAANITLYAQWLLNQTISFTSTAPTNAYVGGPNYSVSATGGGSGNPVTFSIDASASSVCTAVGSLVAFTATGTCVINANQAGNSNYAAAPQAQQSFTVYSAPTAPSAPTSVVGTPGNAQISVAFSGSSSPGTLIGGVSASITQYTATCGSQANTGSGSPIVVSGLTNGTSYTCTVKATNNAPLDSPNSAPSSAVTPRTVPDAPTMGGAAPGNASASVSFSANGDGGAAIDSYRVTCNPGSVSASGASSPILVTGLTNGTTYTCTAAAHNAAGWSAESAASNAFIPPGVQRAFVAATSGNDANVASNCSTTSPCRTFATALQVLREGGEIIATESGDYSPVNITHSAALLGVPGQVAAITASSGNAVTIGAPAVKVILRGLQLTGTGGSFGVSMNQGASLAVENCVVDGFSNTGVSVTGAASVSVAGTMFRKNWRGLSLVDGVTATIMRSQFLGNTGNGVLVGGATTGTTTRAAIHRSLFAGAGSDWAVSAQSLAASANAYAEVTRSSVSNSAQAAVASSTAGGAAELTVNRSKLTGNGTALVQSGAGAVLRSRGNNTLSDNGSNVSGTVSPLSGM